MEEKGPRDMGKEEKEWEGKERGVSGREGKGEEWRQRYTTHTDKLKVRLCSRGSDSTSSTPTDKLQTTLCRVLFPSIMLRCVISQTSSSGSYIKCQPSTINMTESLCA